MTPCAMVAPPGGKSQVLSRCRCCSLKSTGQAARPKGINAITVSATEHTEISAVVKTTAAPANKALPQPQPPPTTQKHTQTDALTKQSKPDTRFNLIHHHHHPPSAYRQWKNYAHCSRKSQSILLLLCMVAIVVVVVAIVLALSNMHNSLTHSLTRSLVRVTALSCGRK